jgi:uncharacterized protein YlxW (UPF0749 family)
MMPLKINGHSFSWSALTSIVIVIFWLAGLSFQVSANGDEIKKQSETKERLVRIEERQETLREDVKEVKKDIKDSREEQQELLAEILRQLGDG